MFVGTVPSTGRPGWSNKGYSRGRHARALVKALADRLLGFLATLSTVGWSVAGAPVWAREHLVAAPNNLVGFWSACPPSVCPAPEGLLGLCFESLGRGRHVPAPGGRDVGSNAKGTDPRTGTGHRPKERQSSFGGIPLLVSGGLSAARFTARLLMEVTTSWVAPVGSRAFSVHEFLGEKRSHISRGVDGSLTAEGQRSSAKSSQRISRLGRVREETPHAPPLRLQTRQQRWRLMRQPYAPPLRLQTRQQR